MAVLKSPLRYPGGKTRACKILDEIATTNFSITQDTWIVSPFFGGGSFEFYLSSKYGTRIIANDIFNPLYAFWKTAKENPHELSDEIEKYLNKITIEDFKQMRATISEQTVFIKALYFFILNRCSFSGSTLSGGFSQQSALTRFTTSSINRIRSLDLSSVVFYNLDFVDFLRKKLPTNRIIFLDPPYYIANPSLYGNNGDVHNNFDHEKLFHSIRDIPKWIMTYNDCGYIRNLYQEFEIIEASWSYGMNASKKSSEIIILNK